MDVGLWTDRQTKMNNGPTLWKGYRGAGQQRHADAGHLYKGQKARI
jgi:hypothetical protein